MDGFLDDAGEAGLFMNLLEVLGYAPVADELDAAAEAPKRDGLQGLAGDAARAGRHLRLLVDTPELSRALDRKAFELVYEALALQGLAIDAASLVLDGRADSGRPALDDDDALFTIIATLVDRDPARLTADGVLESPYGTGAYVEYLWARALASVRALWQVIQAVAVELESQGSLTDGEVRRIIRRTA